MRRRLSSVERLLLTELYLVRAPASCIECAIALDAALLVEARIALFNELLFLGDHVVLLHTRSPMKLAPLVAKRCLTTLEPGEGINQNYTINERNESHWRMPMNQAARIYWMEQGGQSNKAQLLERERSYRFRGSDCKSVGAKLKKRSPKKG